MILCCEINKCIITVIIPQTIIVPTKSIIVASLCDRVKNLLGSVKHTTHLVYETHAFQFKESTTYFGKTIIEKKKKTIIEVYIYFLTKAFFFNTSAVKMYW